LSGVFSDVLSSFDDDDEYDFGSIHDKRTGILGLKSVYIVIYVVIDLGNND